MTDLEPHLVRFETEVPGSPEEVWRAIATGPGTTAWFVPAEIEEREGGTIVTHHGPFGDSTGIVTAWEPPRRFAFEEHDPDTPTWATEILVEARDGGTCVVRLVSGFRDGGDGWNDMVERTREGWVRCLENLRLYRTYFAGEPASQFMAVVRPALTVDGAWARVASGLGVGGIAVGDRVTGPEGGPSYEGVIERSTASEVLVRTPSGLIEVGTWEYDGVVVSARGYRYGAAAGDTSAEQDRWATWLTATAASSPPP